MGTSLPEATGALAVNTLSGNVSVVEPVLPPAWLSAGAPATSVPAGSLAPETFSYTLSPDPGAAFPDSDGRSLVDGQVPLRVWGSPWMDFSKQSPAGLLAWQNAAPSVTVRFSERVQLDYLRVYLAHSDGSNGVALPEWVQLQTPGGYTTSYSVTAGQDVGGMQAVEMGPLDLLTDELSIRLGGSAQWLALGEITFDGVVLAQRRSDTDRLPLSAQVYLGLDPAQNDEHLAGFNLQSEPNRVNFSFPRAADTFGVTAVAEWSPDLRNWQALPHEPAAEAGRRIARLSPFPTERRAFFRLVFRSDLEGLLEPAALSLGEKGTPFTFPAGFFLGTATAPDGQDSLSIAAINDQPAAVGSVRD